MTLKTSKEELQADVEVHVSDHDTDLKVEVDIFDKAGAILATISGKAGLEEGDTDTVHVKERVSATVLKDAAYFRVRIVPQK